MRRKYLCWCCGSETSTSACTRAGDGTVYRTRRRTYALRDNYKRDDRSQTCT